MREIVQYADQTNYYGVWLPERHFHPFGGLFPSPSTFASYMAGQTKQIRFQIGSIVLPLHSPILVAEEWAMVDQLSEGRIDVSFAPGWNSRDFLVTSSDYERRKEIMWNGIGQVRDLWLARDKRIEIFPKPYQKEIPIYITSASSDETSYMAGERGYHLLTHFHINSMEKLENRINSYYMGLQQGGHDKKDKEITVMLHCYIAETYEDVEKQARIPFLDYQNSFLALADYQINYQSERQKDIAGKVMFRKYSPEYSLLGTKESCTKLLDRLRGIGVTQIAALIDFGIDDICVFQSLERLTELKERYSREGY
ncbi:siderophore biosynthesis protein [Paenibacillus curdlanolyticus]|nr:siderophore biosynthesis protein [Paenibacillus curdlanolyticus]